MRQESVDAGESHADGDDRTVAVSNTGAIASTNAGTITGACADDLCRHVE
jgi:hypothetical protein